MDTNTTTQNHYLSVLNNSVELFQTAPQILAQNQERSAKALAVGNKIMEAWVTAWSLEDEQARAAALADADARSNKYLADCTQANKEQKELRAIITQMMDEFKKFFTTAENDIDKTKPGTVPAKIQGHRDAYAKDSYERAERKRKEAEAIAEKAKEAAELAATAETRIASMYNAYLLSKKQHIQNVFNAITLDDIESKAEKLVNFEPVIAKGVIKGFDVALYGKRHTPQEIADILAAVCDEIEPSLMANYVAEMSMLRDELCEKIPSKHAELKQQHELVVAAKAAAEKARIAEEARKEAMQKANDAERERLEAEAEEARKTQDDEMLRIKQQQEQAATAQANREAEDRQRLQQEAEDANKAAEQQAEIKKQGAQTMVLFEKEAALAGGVETSEARVGYEIELTHQAGWVQIFQLWFENEGKGLAIDKIGNTKLDQMKAWAEKHAVKTNTKIESKFIKYNDSFKAINRKGK